MKIGLLGFGTVGGGVYTQLLSQPGLDVKAIMCLQEISLPGVTRMGYEEMLRDPEIDTIVEVMGGEHPAYEAVKAALSSGRNVVSANKAMISRHYPELAALAQASGAAFRFTAAAGGGIPWLTTLERTRRADRLLSVSGIVNGTCNYMLDRMANLGLSYDEAMREAQSLGYAEADPAADVDGWDTQHKLILSCCVAFGALLDPLQVPAAGIRNITARDMEAFRVRGLRCRLMMNGRKTENGVAAFVEPQLVPMGQLAAGVPLNNNLITLEGENVGIQGFYGQGAGRAPTAYNVVQDCIDVSRGAGLYCETSAPCAVDNGAVLRRYYVRGLVDPFLEGVREEDWDGAVVTKALPVSEIHAWAQAQTAPVFFAALPE